MGKTGTMLIFSGGLALESILNAGCGGSSAPTPPVDTRTVFQQKTDAKFSDYDCTFSTGTQYFAEGIGTIVADESAICVADGRDPLNILFFDRSANGPTALETQMTSLAPPPYKILVGQGQNVGTTIDTFYENTSFSRRHDMHEAKMPRSYAMAKSMPRAYMPRGRI